MDISRPLTAAAARRAGVSRWELKGPLWRSPFRDVHVWSALPAHLTEQRIREAAALLPQEGAITGWAAANLLGAKALDGTDPQSGRSGRQPVPLLLPLDRQMTRRGDVRVIRSPLPADEVQGVCGIRVTTPARTMFESLRWVPLVDAVVAADALSSAGVVSLVDAAAFVDSRRGWKHVGRARQALRLADARAESPMETRLRLLWISTDLPWPDVNPSLHLRATGEFLARPDLFDAEAALAVEYDGAHHRTPDQHRADNLREERLERCGITVLRFDAYDVLARPQHTIARIREGRERGLARNRRRDQWSRSSNHAK